MQTRQGRGRATPPVGARAPRLPTHPVTFTPEYLRELEDAGVEIQVKIAEQLVWVVPRRAGTHHPEITYRALATLCDAAAVGFKPVAFRAKRHRNNAVNHDEPLTAPVAAQQALKI